jgi:hypothetical protein
VYEAYTDFVHPYLGSPSLGNFPIFAQSGCVNDDINGCQYSKSHRAVERIPESVHAKPGYFDITLANNIRTESTVTNRTALYRITFPEIPLTPNTTLSPHILVDLTDLPNTRSEANITVDAGTGRITGGGVFSPSFGIGTYKSYFCLDFDGAKVKDAGVWSNTRATKRATSLQIVPGDVRQTPSNTPAGGWVRNFHVRTACETYTDFVHRYFRYSSRSPLKITRFMRGLV